MLITGDGLTLVEGDIDTLGEALDEADGDKLTEGDVLGETDVEGEADGDWEADGEAEGL